MGKISSTYRAIEILKELENGKTLCIERLAEYYETSTRSIRRDFEMLKELFGDIFISPQKGCYKVIGKNLLHDVLNSTELYMLKNILKLSDKTKLSLRIDDKTKQAILKEESNSPYLFKQKPYEEIYENQDKFKALEKTINNRKEIRIRYSNDGRISNFTLKPYKILFLSENFYLASEIKTKHGQNVMLSRIAMIEHIEETGKTFFQTKDLMDFIEFIQSPWATYKPNFKAHLKEVIIEIQKAQAKYFKLKKFFPTQKIIEEKDDGTIVISYMVTSENEVVGLIKQWLPFAKVISPQGLVKQFNDIVKRLNS